MKWISKSPVPVCDTTTRHTTIEGPIGDTMGKCKHLLIDGWLQYLCYHTEALPVPSTLDVGSIGWVSCESHHTHQNNISTFPPPHPYKSVQQDGTDEQNGYVFAQSAPENLEGITLYDELMSAMDPVALGGSKADLQMLLKEKEQWDNDRSELVSEGQRFREEKEALERSVYAFPELYQAIQKCIILKVRTQGFALKSTICNKRRKLSTQSYLSASYFYACIWTCIYPCGCVHACVWVDVYCLCMHMSMCVRPAALEARTQAKQVFTTHTTHIWYQPHHIWVARTINMRLA